MSPKCEVPSLNEISTSFVAKQLIRVLARLDNQDVTWMFAIIKSYFENLETTGNVYQDILNLILNAEYLEPSIRYFAMELLLQENVKTLATGIFPVDYYDKILHTVKRHGTGLTALNLKGVWVKDDQLPILYDIIKSLASLNVLNIPYIANDEVLRLIGEFSENLKMLDVSGETDITEIGIDALCSGNLSIRESLSVVNIGAYGEENVCHMDVALLIAGLPNLVNLGSYSFVGKSIAHIVKCTDFAEDFTTKLQYLHDTKTDIETANYIIRACPHLETIYFDGPDVGVISTIEQMKNISKIKLCKFRCREFVPLMDKIGSKICSLMLSQGCGPLNISRLAEKCPNLLSLEIFKTENLTHDDEVLFKKLEHVEILHSDLRTSTFKYVTTCCPSLKKILIGDEIKMSDADMSRLLYNNKFEHLEELWFIKAPLLTLSTIELLMETCPKLRILGQLNGWQITPDDLMLLKAIIDSTNTDLILTTQGMY